MLLGISKQLVYAFPGFYNKETISSNKSHFRIPAYKSVSHKSTIKENILARNVLTRINVKSALNIFGF